MKKNYPFGKLMIIFTAGLFAAMALFLVACSNSSGKGKLTAGNSSGISKISGDLWNKTEEEAAMSGVPTGNYILMSLDQGSTTMRFYNVDLKRMQTYKYSSATEYYDAYGEDSSVVEFKPGAAVKIALSSGTSTVTAISKSDEALEMKDISKYTLTISDPALRYVTIGKRKYRLADECLAFSNTGEQTDITNISDSDVISLRGYNDLIYSMVVETGHGTVTFTGTEDYMGGYVVIGNQKSAKISNELKMDIREGEYLLSAANNGKGGSTTITVKKGEETMVDLSKLDTASNDKYCEVTFSLTPSDTVLKINGNVTDTSHPVRLKYGTYVLQMEATGYTAVTRVMLVNSPKATVMLDVAKLAATDAAQAATSTSDSATTSSSSGSSSSAASDAADSVLSSYSSLLSNSDDDDDSSSASVSSLVDSILGTDTSGLTDSIISIITGE